MRSARLYRAPRNSCVALLCQENERCGRLGRFCDCQGRETLQVLNRATPQYQVRTASEGLPELFLIDHALAGTGQAARAKNPKRKLCTQRILLNHQQADHCTDLLLLSCERNSLRAMCL